MYPHLILRIGGILLLSLTITRLSMGIGTRPMERWDEQTNLEVVTQSLRASSFPFLSRDAHPFFEKPPLWYWMGMAAGSLVSPTLLTLRIFSALCGLGIILGTVFLSTRWWGKIAGVVTWMTILTTNHLFALHPAGYFSTHTLASADVDSLFILLLLISFSSCVSLMQSGSGGVLAGISTGLAVLTKGPLGILPIALCSLFVLRKKHVLVAFLREVLVACCIVFFWYALMYIQFGNGFLSSHIHYHLLTRAVSPIEGHTQPIWYYLTLLATPQIFSFAPLLLISLLVCLRHPKITNDPIFSFTLIMMFVLFIIPTLVQTRLAWYILPIYPFAALVIGKVASTWMRR